MRFKMSKNLQLFAYYFKNLYIFMYLFDSTGSQLQHVGSLVGACKLLIVACEIQFPERKRSHSVMSDSLQVHGLQPSRLFCLCMEFSRQGYWHVLPFPSPGDLPNSGIKPRCPALQADSFPSEPPGKPLTRDQRIKSDPGSNLGHLLWEHGFQPLDHQGSALITFKFSSQLTSSFTKQFSPSRIGEVMLQ